MLTAKEYTPQHLRVSSLLEQIAADARSTANWTSRPVFDDVVITENVIRSLDSVMALSSNPERGINAFWIKTDPIKK